MQRRPGVKKSPRAPVAPPRLAPAPPSQGKEGGSARGDWPPRGSWRGRGSQWGGGARPRGTAACSRVAAGPGQTGPGGGVGVGCARRCPAPGWSSEGKAGVKRPHFSKRPPRSPGRGLCRGRGPEEAARPGLGLRRRRCIVLREAVALERHRPLVTPGCCKCDWIPASFGNKNKIPSASEGAAVRGWGDSRLGLQPGTPPQPNPLQRPGGCAAPRHQPCAAGLAAALRPCLGLPKIGIRGERGPGRLWVSCQSLEIPSPGQGGAGECPSWELRAGNGATESKRDCLAEINPNWSFHKRYLCHKSGNRFTAKGVKP